ncbi:MULTISPECIES: phosphoadenylyl-sulfate reductase [Chryseobacterium]|uniref:Adenosine 5'-phosphosulfate reductase n=1 Tax=Chryseobacterium camelliae TaxID=1265445 RepID=A0ABU0THM8_9FLAO|nr:MULTISPECIES: phosphoadenylyl-sulfate reductase [Chryseobacterium]MDT3409587.1 phosphoadenosine phosphosulfate reductase [Pseudacidovorax intermedius]MDQ1096552.1 phosphoadenosine phosphosulfate reductase [Chryseobacterium camelliae]MDQ1100493.1 phosphoadenosine phosphosulfate reductase [Chryseobacterium sp. SORGH_AS_1048]MDR6087833.1 phosphoadenosine phosphosulfate reductase [Chryseobacterium sp. SORGH_AS_0909]MDR6132209.1 phosphoadenosine phosphosulfate reductase [Chryseobacterium sp. SOR
MISTEDADILKELPAEEGLKFITSRFSSGVVFSTSLGQEDQVITDMIFKNKFPIKVFTLDTGRLFYEHYELLSNNNSKYKIKTQVYFPEPSDVEQFVNEKGINAFYHSVENRKECCYIRKVKPLNRALENAKVWITGLRAEQSENRGHMPVLEWDEERQLYKYNPLMHWSYQEVLDYLQDHRVQELSLHKKGFISVGCQPCTRAISEGENPRAGRWWWETSQKECGLHT